MGFDPAPIQEALTRLDGWTRRRGSAPPMFAGAVALVAHRGAVVATAVAGHAVRYADGTGAELPAAGRVPMRADMIFDLASLSKLFTAMVTMQQAERGLLALDAPVAGFLPEFAPNGRANRKANRKATVTVRQLLTHTSGLRAWLPLWREHPDPASRLAAVLTDPPVAPPGTQCVYSDLNLITLGALVERVAGRPLDALVREGITAPLGLADTGYRPDPSIADRVAATEYQSDPPRGLVRGAVHDENAWSLGGVVGHAGVFSTAADLAVLGQAILDGGAPILRPWSAAAMLTVHHRDVPGCPHGLGFELDRPRYMGALAGRGAAGHTGYTGTSLVLDPASRSLAVLLTNRVHPSRGWGSCDPARRAVADALARALAG